MNRLFKLVVLLGLLALGSMLLINGCRGDPEAETPEPEVTVETIVARLQPIQELSTLKVSVSGIVNASQPGRHWWQGENRLVLLVRGQALYSIDLSGLKVEVEEGRVRIELPPPRVAEAWVDVEQSRIWKREVGRFRSENQVRLEEEAWHSAHKLVKAGAETESHLRLAMVRTENRITGIVHQVDAGLQVEILWRESVVL